MADNTIALQTMLPKIDSPYEIEAGAQKIRQLQQATQQGAYQQQQQQQAQADDTSYRQALQSSGGDNARMLSALAGTGNYAGFAKAQAADLALRKGNADIEKDQASTGETKLKALNQAFSLHRDQINNVTDPSTAAQWVASAYKDPVLGPLVAQSGPIETAIARIPKDPSGFAQWKMQAGLSADEYVKRTTISAEEKARNDRIASEGSANRGNAITIQNMISARQDSRSNTEPSMSNDTLDRIARQVIRGDKSGLQNLGRGGQGAANLTAIQNRVTDEAKRQGLAPEDIVSMSAEFEGLKTGMRATGNISARVENASEEAAKLAPLALDASRQVARSGLLPFGKAQVMFDTQTNDPALSRFATANMGLATAYANAMARGQKATVTDNEHARALLSTAKSQPAYEATVNQMLAEIEQAKAAPRAVREQLSTEIKGKRGSSPSGVVNFGDLK